MPAGCAALVFYGRTKLPDPLTVMPTGSSAASRMLDTLVGSAYIVLMLRMAVTLAIVSGGGQSSLPTWLTVAFGAMVVARGVSRIKRLAEKIQVG